MNHDSESLRARAAEYQAVAETFANPETRRRLQVLADEYRRRAEAAEFLERAPEPAPDDAAEAADGGAGAPQGLSIRLTEERAG